MQSTTGHRPDTNIGGAGIQEHFSAGTGGRACSEYVINQDDVFPIQAGATRQSKCLSHILEALISRESRLGASRLDALQDLGLHGDFARITQSASQTMGLVE